MAKKSSTKSKPGRRQPTPKRAGGKRAGAGRKPDAAKQLEREWLDGAYKVPDVHPDAGERLTPVQMASRRMIDLMYHEDGAVALKACTTVMDRCWGKPRETVDVNLGGEHVVTAITAAKAHALSRIGKGK
jgi:hypothetical protein